jgi:hypothetical protein
MKRKQADVFNVYVHQAKATEERENDGCYLYPRSSELPSGQFVPLCYSVNHLKRNLNTTTYYYSKIKSEVGPPPCNKLSQPPSPHYS